MVIPAACLVLAAAALCTPSAVARRRIARLWPPATARRTRRPWAAGPLLAGALTGLLAAGPGGALAGALVAAVARRQRSARRASRGAAAVTEQFADSVRRMTDELKAGSHPAAALAGVAADGPQAREILGPAAAAAELGDDIPAALRRAGEDRPEVAADMERVAAAWSLAEQHGIPLAELLSGAHSDIRWRLRFGHTVRAQLAGPRATATILTALPVLGLCLGQLVGAEPLSVLRSGVLGQVLLVVGVGLAAAGAAWSERIMQSAAPR